MEAPETPTGSPEEHCEPGTEGDLAEGTTGITELREAPLQPGPLKTSTDAASVSTSSEHIVLPADKFLDRDEDQPLPSIENDTSNPESLDDNAVDVSENLLDPLQEYAEDATAMEPSLYHHQSPPLADQSKAQPGANALQTTSARKRRRPSSISLSTYPALTTSNLGASDRGFRRRRILYRMTVQEFGIIYYNVPVYEIEIDLGNGRSTKGTETPSPTSSTFRDV